MTVEMPLQEKVIVIIGGTSGLGLSAAHACIDAGARVVIVGRDQDKLASAQRSLGGSCRTVAGDARDAAIAERAVEVAVDEFGALDGLYHVAGGSGRSRGDGPLESISDEGWQFTLDLNLTSLFYSNRAAVRQFVRQARGGSIVNMSSVLADSPGPRYFATHTYAAAKAGVIGLTKAAAAYYAPQRIRLNVLCPALVETPMAQRAASDAEIMDYIATKQPLDGGRIGYPADCDSAVVYFLSDAARFVTGQVLAVDGGWCVSEGQYV